MTTQAIPFAEFIETRFKDGKLYKGAHEPDGLACYHEAQNVYEGRDWSDSTDGTLDLRGLNDALWSSDDVRTRHMLPLYAITNRTTGWPTWSKERQQAFAKLVAEQTIRQIVPIALRAAGARLPSHREALEAAAQRCADEGTESAARSAWSAEWSAESAARSAASAAWSARSAASAAWSAWSAASAASAAEAAAAAASAWSAADEPLIAICAIFREAYESAR